MLTIPPVPLKGDVTDHGSGRRVNFSKGHPCGQLRCAQRVTRRFFWPHCAGERLERLEQLEIDWVIDTCETPEMGYSQQL